VNSGVETIYLLIFYFYEEIQFFLCCDGSYNKALAGFTIQEIRESEVGSYENSRSIWNIGYNTEPGSG